MKQKLITVVYGPPMSGKTLYAEEMRKRYGLERVMDDVQVPCPGIIPAGTLVTVAEHGYQLRGMLKFEEGSVTTWKPISHALRDIGVDWQPVKRTGKKQWVVVQGRMHYPMEGSLNGAMARAKSLLRGGDMAVTILPCWSTKRRQG